MHQPVVHYVLAMYLAVLSPALCCCSIQTQLDRLLGSESSARTGRCCVPSKARPVVSCPHCAAVAVQAACCGDSTSPSQSDSDRTCHCHEESRDLKPADGTASNGKLVGVSVEAPMMAAGLEPRAGVELPAAGFHRCSRDCRPPNDLLALRCALRL